ncbi:MAG TPA: FtsX-like permease family protein [Bryobacteraceae bacterium]|nr:FtsX-like permease family protein [Bryobacteraceae bacterium]
MMPDRKMFWRIIRRLLAANRGRLVVILLALGAGAAITAALLNLQVDAKRRITTEFRAFGPNVIIAAKDSSPTGSGTLPGSLIHSVPASLPSGSVASISLLYIVANVSVPPSDKSFAVVVAGSNPFAFVRSYPAPATGSGEKNFPPGKVCVLGARVARQLAAQQDAELVLAYGERRESCRVASFHETGGPEDDRITISLSMAQRLAAFPDRVSVIELVVPGTPDVIQNYIANLQQHLPDADVRPIRQFTEGEAKIYDRISGILSATVALVLLLTALCVMAAMTNVAMERRNDVGLMKAIGGATRRVLRLFLAEAALLGLTGGVLGAAVGILLSMWLGKAVFGVAARPRLIVYPVAVALTIIVAIAGAYPLRRLANIRPAAVFRGEA